VAHFCKRVQHLLDFVSSQFGAPLGNPSYEFSLTLADSGGVSESIFHAAEFLYCLGSAGTGDTARQRDAAEGGRPRGSQFR
jgi:hypothetical protein